MKRLGIIINTKRPRAADSLEELFRVAQACDFTLFAENASTVDLLKAEYLPIEQFRETVDVVLALGGDGTVLYAARAVHGADIPIMGINLGSLGFLTSVGESEIDRALTALSTGDYKVSVRDVAECRILKDGTEAGRELALNDIVLGWGASSRIVSLKLSIDGEAVSSFMCDGMIVSTPTGSTGHALSAGGPILHPEIAGFGISVICPHTLSSRPLVIPKTSTIEIEVMQAAKELIVSIDGQDEYRIEKGWRISISQGAHQVKFLQLPDHSYFSILAQKLHWRGSSL